MRLFFPPRGVGEGWGTDNSYLVLVGAEWSTVPLSGWKVSKNSTKLFCLLPSRPARRVCVRALRCLLQRLQRMCQVGGGQVASLHKGTCLLANRNRNEYQQRQWKRCSLSVMDLSLLSPPPKPPMLLTFTLNLTLLFLCCLASRRTLNHACPSLRCARVRKTKWKRNTNGNSWISDPLWRLWFYFSVRRTPCDAKKGASKWARERWKHILILDLEILHVHLVELQSGVSQGACSEPWQCCPLKTTERDEEDLQEVTDAERSMFPLVHNGPNNSICAFNYAGSTQVRQRNSNRRLWFLCLMFFCWTGSAPTWWSSEKRL